MDERLLRSVRGPLCRVIFIKITLEMVVVLIKWTIIIQILLDMT